LQKRKKINNYRMKIKHLLPAVLLLASGFAALAQSTTSYQGTWQGTLNIGGGLRLVFHIKDNGNGGLISTADSPDQSAFGMKCDSTWVTAGVLTIEMRELSASYKGKLVGDSALDGIFKQGPGEFPLILKRTSTAPAAPKRPQEPHAPFSYKAEEVEYNNAGRTLRYGATITIPQGKGPFPAALLITGSGPQNRDEEIMGHKPFAVLADALTKNGFVVLRVDDRGIGKSTGRFNDATSADFADDARAGFDYLLSRPEVNKKKAGLIGHSEGGMIAPMIASDRKDVNFIVLLAAPGIRISELMTEQNAAIFHRAGISTPTIDAYIPLYQSLLKAILSTSDSAVAVLKAKVAIRDWAMHTDSTILKELFLSSSENQEKLAVAMADELKGKWFRYFMSFDPTSYLESLSCKVLALNGTEDIQVVANTNLAGIEAALKKSKSKSYLVKPLPGLNHLFQLCKACTIAEYAQLEETFSPAALVEINNWLNKNVK
jgi:pimeloyl-ACP methyl ester carboxylesterase